MQVQMLALDLDGTLLRNDKTVSPFSVNVLRCCREKGIKVVLATARAEKVAQRILNSVQPDAVISSGGALVTTGGRVITCKKFSVAETEAIIAEVLKKPSLLNLTVETDEGYFVTWETAEHPDHAHAIHYDFSVPLGCGAYKITPEFGDEQDASAVAALFPDCGLIPFSGERWYRFARKDATKYTAVQSAAAYFGIEIAQVAAFGDDVNDLEMIRCCGVGVAMGNAIEEVKDAADDVCLSNEEDGVARWIEKNLM